MKNKKTVPLTVALLIITAVICRFIGMNTYGYISLIVAYIRSFIYIALFTAWGISIRHRIVHTRIRCYLTAVAFLIVTWLLCRSYKYYIAKDFNVIRYLWYSFYIFLLSIPMFSVFIALYIGKPDNYCLPRWTFIFAFITFILLSLVLTNDLHQLVFAFSSDDRSNYSYAIGYWLIFAWLISCALFAIVVMIIKCRVPYSKKMLFLPILPIICATVYTILYIYALPWLSVIAGDMTVMFSLFYAAVFESCIQSGLIRSNTHYASLLRISGIALQITDNDFVVRYSANKAIPIEKDIMKASVSSPVTVKDGIRISGAPITNGYVIWQDDISELLELYETLEENKKDLSSQNAVLLENYAAERNIRHLEERNRLYDEIRCQTGEHITFLNTLLEKFAASGDEKEKRRLLHKIVVIGVYIKRRDNLIFLSEQNDELFTDELSLCFDEALDNLRLSGVKCEFYINAGETMPAVIATAIYDYYESVIETVYDNLEAMLICICRTDNRFTVNISIVLNCETDGFIGSNTTVYNKAGNTYEITFCTKSGEDMV